MADSGSETVTNLPGMPHLGIQRAIRHFRGQRMRLLRNFFDLGPEMTLLDLGGLPQTWTEAGVEARVFSLNLPVAYLPGQVPERMIFGDGCQLPFPDQSFDLVFSNSVIEHVGGWQRQQQFAAEVRRVGRAYFIQTPDYHFPLEHHLLTPFLHWFPRSVQRSVATRFTLWDVVARPDAEQRRYYIEHYLNDIRLLRAQEMRALFPDGELIRERVAGWSKSLVMLKRP